MRWVGSTVEECYEQESCKSFVQHSCQLSFISNYLYVLASLTQQEGCILLRRILFLERGVDVVIVHPVIGTSAECIQRIANDIIAPLRPCDPEYLGLPVLEPYHLRSQPFHILHKDTRIISDSPSIQQVVKPSDHSSPLGDLTVLLAAVSTRYQLRAQQGPVGVPAV